MRDPGLTPFGKSQCAHLAETFTGHSSVDLLVCSPLRRTIYTTLLAFQPAVERGVVPIVALPEAQETPDLPCDTGSDLSVLIKEFQGMPVDLSRVTVGWNSKKGRWAPSQGPIKKRALETRQWLKARPENTIVLVSHGGFLHWLTEDWNDFNEAAGKHSFSVTWVPGKDGGADEQWLGTGWKNVEYRTYQFKEGSDSMMETAQSREARQETEISRGPSENMQQINTADNTSMANAKPLVARV